jgi:hypothetical protein
MKNQRSTQTRIARKLSDVIIARRYLDLQRLRDEVRKAETKLRTTNLEEASGSEATCLLNYSGRETHL